MSVGSYLPRPPPSIIAGPAIPIHDFSVAILKSAVPNNAALPAKQYPLLTAILIEDPVRLAHLENVGTFNPAICVLTSTSPGLPPPPSV